MNGPPDRREEAIKWAQKRLADTNAYLQDLTKVLGMRLLAGNGVGLVVVAGILSSKAGIELNAEQRPIAEFAFAAFSVGLLGAIVALMTLMYFLKSLREWRIERLRKVLNDTNETMEFEEQPPFMQRWSKITGGLTILGIAGLSVGLGLSILAMLV